MSSFLAVALILVALSSSPLANAVPINEPRTEAERQYGRCRVEATNRLATAASSGRYGGVPYALSATVPMCRSEGAAVGVDTDTFSFSFAMGGATTNATVVISPEALLSPQGQPASLVIDGVGTAHFAVAEAPLTGARTVSARLSFQGMQQYTVVLCEGSLLGTTSGTCKGTDYFPAFFVVLVVLPAIACAAFWAWAVYVRFGDAIGRALRAQLVELKKRRAAPAAAEGGGGTLHMNADELQATAPREGDIHCREAGGPAPAPIATVVRKDGPARPVAAGDIVARN